MVPPVFIIGVNNTNPICVIECLVIYKIQLFTVNCYGFREIAQGLARIGQGFTVKFSLNPPFWPQGLEQLPQYESQTSHTLATLQHTLNEHMHPIKSSKIPVLSSRENKYRSGFYSKLLVKPWSKRHRVQIISPNLNRGLMILWQTLNTHQKNIVMQ